MTKRKLTMAQQRLLGFFKDVEDESIRDIMIEVLNIESRNRSAKSFPIRKVRDVIDGNAKLIEREETES